MAPRRKCPVCGSKQWHKEPSSGMIACSEGHVLQNYRTESGDAEDLGNHTMRKRTLKSGRKKKERESRANPQFYHGARARFHYFQCLQLLLRHQVLALTALWELPPEFEIICRDIWALHLNLLPNPPPAEPFFHILEQNGERPDPVPNVKPPLPSRGQEEEPPEGENKIKTREEAESSGSESSLSSDENQGEEDPELTELLRENSETSSSDEEADEAPQSKPGNRPKHQRGLVGKYDGPLSTVAVLVLACWTMRLPVMYMDFIKIIDSYKLPYLESIRILPPSLTLHLTKHIIQALSPHHAPSTLQLHGLASHLAKLMYAKYSVFTPELNAAPILWRVTRYLGGTPTLYDLAKRLGRVLSLPLTLHYSLAPSLKRIRRTDPESHKFDNVPPELSLMATVIVVLKMVYGLDGKVRLPREPSDPACALPRLEEYLALLKRMDESDAESRENQCSSRSAMPVGDADDATIDEYLDFCERVLIGTTNGNTGYILDKFFPLSSENTGETPTVAGSDQIVLALPPTTVNADDETVLRPGESHTIFSSRDVLGILPEELELILRRGAQSVGVSGSYLCGAVERYEYRIARWWKGERRREKEGRRQEGDS
ncbi:hypothetical protein SERLA73DRAFT_177450 [Serpula lacrymans var. lacrymans S7.3]|uniref:RRN7-type domain-containing protein n=2 Tax=Serpula lacrymans var. lacrymans TaxID=341189 RepID=F8PP00_SERL3|nr:uncharacterized protein SERLADRAFT_461048 [Serpula lacrymans var. lacrymans S7.9]EGO01877.1 hypothetical protein SERLA73DRAFT_177450 [Serpula lacrymans var. lacrymans S7.3]EGO27504.1 hypothetical protein SERLADRAFT_461048 [Serpula lacrymans var. lacrymans S7.9]